MDNTSLITVTHDPEGRNAKLFTELKDIIEGIYSNLYIAISEETSPILIDVLENSRFKTRIIPKLGPAHARREVLGFGLIEENQYFHYCDFDRLLTWALNHPAELKETANIIPRHDYLIIGRTERAMQTHPAAWIETEKITNKICSLELGKEVDITGGSCSFSKIAATYINKHSTEKMTDAEWAMISHRLAGLHIDYIPVEGLEYYEAINRVTREMDTSEAWLRRLKLSLIISETAYNIGK